LRRHKFTYLLTYLLTYLRDTVVDISFIPSPWNPPPSPLNQLCSISLLTTLQYNTVRQLTH